MTEMNSVIVPVIMAGGTATRLWPLSTSEFPKQFHHLTSPRTMIQETALRLRSGGAVEFADPIVVCNRRHVWDVEAQLAEVGVRPSMIVAEPFGRNTAAVAALAGALVGSRHPGAFALLLPADHLISNAEAFGAAIARGATAEGRIVTFGIEPREPQEGFGYIQRGRQLGGGVYAVERFVEKPTRTVAKAYLLDGGYLWNSGIFLFRPELIEAEFRAYRPEIGLAVTDALEDARESATLLELRDESFAKVPAESFDIAVMERTRRAAVVPCDLDWTDIGSWSELWRLGPLDCDRNRMEGDVIVLETGDSLVWSDGPPVGVIGLKDVIVVAAHGSVLVAAKSHAQGVRLLADAFARRAGNKRPDDESKSLKP